MASATDIEACGDPAPASVVMSDALLEQYRLDRNNRRAPAVFAHHPQQLTQVIIVGDQIGVDVVHHPEVRSTPATQKRDKSLTQLIALAWAWCLYW